ncbi:hemerythrin domain-containing protein [Streptosporangium sp. NPDC051023]|uniref:hemerythrin domain-containing protein n=1 Tax=Streptosporangium sp. NPDC051023 TaxID=3155410 RepID=UPI00344DBB44
MSVPTSSENSLHGMPDHLCAFALMHVAMRRDARRLGKAAPALDPAMYGRVGAWWRQVRDVIDWHHRSEDDVVWPALRRRVRGFAASEKVMNHDHVALDQAMEAVSAALGSNGDRAALVSASAWFDDLIREHLRLEEAVVFPIFSGDLTVDEYLSIERRVLASASAGILTFLLPWMLDQADRTTAAKVNATIPPPIRLFGGTLLRWRYDHSWRWW